MSIDILLCAGLNEFKRFLLNLLYNPDRKAKHTVLIGDLFQIAIQMMTAAGLMKMFAKIIYVNVILDSSDQQITHV